MATHWCGVPECSNSGPLLLLVCAGQKRYRGVARSKESSLEIEKEFFSRIADIQIAHRQLADAVVRGKGGRAFLHRQAFRLVGQVRTRRVEDRVVVAAAQLEGDLASHGAGDPTLRHLAAHHCLWIEPSPLVE